jgi:hypothetical protein
MAIGGLKRYGLISEVTGQPANCRALLVALTFIRAHIAAASVFLIGTWLTALVGLQQMTVAIGAATRVARINRRASREKRDSLCGSAVVPQLSQLGVSVVQIAGTVEIAGAVAAQVSAI